MKITLSGANLVSVTGANFVQAAEASQYIYIYGVASGKTVKVTYRKPNGNLIGPLTCVYDEDPDEVLCYIATIPSKALSVDGDVGVSIAVYSSGGAIETTPRATATVLSNDSIELPEELETEITDDIYLHLNQAIADIADLEDDKADITYVDDEIAEILDGTKPFTGLDVNGNADISGNAIIHGDLEVRGESNLTSAKISGDNMSMELHKIVNLANGTSATDAVNKGQLDTKVNKAGDTMSGALAMGGNKVTGLANGSADGDAVNIGQLTLSLAYKQDISEKDQANGYAGLNSSGKLANSVIPALAITERFVVASEVAQLALTAQQGDVAIRTDLNKSYIHNGGTAGTMSDWTELLTPTDLVLSVNGETGAVTIDASDIATDEVGQTVQDALDIQDGLTTDHEERLDIIEATQLVVTNITGGTAETPTQSTKVPSIAKATEIADTAVQAITQINQDEALSRFSPPLIGTVTDETEVTDTAQGFHAHTYSLKGQTFVQLVKNGNFINTGNWTASGATMTVSGNVATVIATGQYGWVYQRVSVVQNNVYFISIDYKSPSTSIQIRWDGFSSAPVFQATNGTNEWTTFSAIKTAPSTTSDAYAIALLDPRTSGWTSFQMKNVKVINLTALGNIPGTSTAWTTLTASQIAAYLGEYDTTAEIVAKAIAGGETNKVTNGEFTANTTGWENFANATISHSSGKLRAVPTSAGSLMRVATACAFVNGRTYRIQAQLQYTGASATSAITSRNTGDVLVQTLFTTTSGESLQTIDFVITATANASHISFGAPASGTTAMELDNILVYDITDYFATSGIHSFTPELINATDGTNERNLVVATIGNLNSLPDGSRDLFENTIQPDGERLMQITKIAHRLPLPYGQVGGQDIWQLKKVGTANTRFEMKIENFWTAYTPDMDATRCYRNTFTSGLTYIDESGVGQTLASISLGSLGLETWAEDATPTIIVEGSGYGALNTYENVAENFVVGVALNATSTALLVCISGGLDQSELDAYIASNPIQVVIPYDTYGTATNNAYTFPHTQVTFNTHCADTAGLTIYQDQDGQHFVSFKVANATADTLSELYTHLLANPITLVIPIVEAQFEHVISGYLTQYDESTFSVTSSTFVKPSAWELSYIKDLNKVIAAILAAIA